jgi:hypothetical protein
MGLSVQKMCKIAIWNGAYASMSQKIHSQEILLQNVSLKHFGFLKISGVDAVNFFARLHYL